MQVEIKEIEGMDRDRLLGLWPRVLSQPVPHRMSTPLMRRILAFELQARRYGGLSRKLRRELERIEGSDPVRPSSPSLKPGARLLREWNGEAHVVEVRECGFAWRGRNYGSLSAIAREITGARWSGPRFFGVNGVEKRK